MFNLRGLKGCYFVLPGLKGNFHQIIFIILWIPPSLLYAQNDWHFVDESDIRLPDTTSLSQAIAGGEINTIGVIDILVGQQPDIIRNLPGVAQLFLNNRWGYFSLADSSVFPQRNDETTEVMLFDANADGYLDAFVANANFKSDFLAINDGNGNFHIDWARLLPDTANALTGDYADVDGDGDIDVCLLGNNEVRYSHRMWINNGQGYFQDEIFRLPALYSFYRYVGLVDLNGDWNPDIVAVYYDGLESHPTIIINDGAGYFTDETSLRLPQTENFCWAAAFSDIDGDKDFDIILLYADRLGFLVNDGSGYFTDETAERGPLYPDGGAICLRSFDADNDGDEDYVIGTGVTHPDFFFINDGAGYFADETALRWPYQANGTYNIFPGDLNGDGTGDIFRVGFPSSRSRIYINTLDSPDSLPPSVKNQTIFPSIDTTRGPYPVRLIAKDGIAIPTQLSAYLFYSLDGRSFNGVPLHYTGAYTYYGNLPQMASGQTIYYYYGITDRWQNTSYVPRDASDSVFSFTYLPGYTAIDENEEELPKHISLFAYPNPFNSQTTITLAGLEKPEIDIYDVSGFKIATLIGENGKLIWNAVGYASGVYFARVKNKNITASLKLIYIK